MLDMIDVMVVMVVGIGGVLRRGLVRPVLTIIEISRFIGREEDRYCLPVVVVICILTIT